MSRLFKPGWLSAVVRITKQAMEKGVLDIELMDYTMARDCKRKHSTNSSRLDNGTECLTKINPGALRVTTNHPSGLVALERTVWVVFDLEHPLA
jgi:hypothetical protein